MSDKRSLDVNWGGLLINSPAPLQLTLNRCSHNCLYCFANINKPDRKAFVKQTKQLIESYEEKKTYLGYLLRNKALIDFSNLSDPFSKNNYELSLEFIELLTEKGFNFSFATKGGYGIDETLKHINPSVFYISIPFLDEDRRKAVEPNAPPIEERLNLVKQLKDSGHKVLIGINPFVPDWIDDISNFISLLSSLKVDGIWTQLIHLSRYQLAKLSPLVLNNLGDNTIDYCSGRLTQWQERLKELREEINAKGIKQYYNQNPFSSHFFSVYNDTYKNTFPMMQEWINYCYKNKKPFDLIYINEFVDFFTKKMPITRGFNLRDYINSTHFSKALYGLYIPRYIENWEDFFCVIWHFWELAFNPCNIDCFAFLATEKGFRNTYDVFIDKNTNEPILIFLPCHHTPQKFIDISILEKKKNVIENGYILANL